MEFLFAAVGLIAGLGFGFFTGTKRGADRERQLFKAEVGSAKSEAQRIIEEARNKADSVVKDAEIEARETQLEAKANFEDEVKAERAELLNTEKQLRKKEDKLDKRAALLDDREREAKELERAAEKEHKKALKESEKATRELEEARNKLQEVAKLSAEEARKRLEEEMLGEAKLEAAKKIKAIEEEAKDEADKRARKIIAMTVQRYSGDYVVERCVTTVPLPSDDMKGRIIGREGRNIRAIEAATGVDLIVDDTPEAVVVSCFDKVRREIASISLKRLIEDGRIHPGRIEEVVGKVKKEVAQVIKEAGEQAAFELGLHGLHPEILKTIGRLRYRTSYGQNMWSHSIEVGWLCGMIAAELGLNVKEARRAGLLHDIGKAMDHEHEGSHALIGAEFCKKHGEKPRVVNAIAAHHNEVPVESVYAYLVMASDALSGARPGARREILETYIQRLEDIESISCSFPGVNKCYAFQAGRDVRVVVDHAKVSDEEAIVLSRDIAKRIESELTYPGQIKISVIRETRATEYAR